MTHYPWRVLSMFFNVSLHFCSFSLHADWWKSDSSVDVEPQGIGGRIKIPEMYLQAPLPFPATLPECPKELTCRLTNQCGPL